MDFPINIPFARHLGFQLLHMQDGRAELAFTPAEQHCNSFHMAHGGAVMTLLDIGMSLAARSLQEPERIQTTGAVTVEMKTSFMRPGEGPLRCEAQVMHRTATLAFCEARVSMGNGALVAHGTGTFKFVRAVTGQGRQIKPLRQSGLDGAQGEQQDG